MERSSSGRRSSAINCCERQCQENPHTVASTQSTRNLFPSHVIWGDWRRQATISAHGASDSFRSELTDRLATSCSGESGFGCTGSFAPPVAE
eukprot:3594154-Rhodomonas_salina.1